MPGQAGNSLPIKKKPVSTFLFGKIFPHSVRDTVGSTFFNLGIFSAMNRLNGLGVNVLGAVTGRDMNGVQISGISNMVGGSMRGVQVAGITNINGNNLSGLSVSGLVGHHRESRTGNGLLRPCQYHGR